MNIKIIIKNIKKPLILTETTDYKFITQCKLPMNQFAKFIDLLCLLVIKTVIILLSFNLKLIDKTSVKEIVSITYKVQ